MEKLSTLNLRELIKEADEAFKRSDLDQLQSIQKKLVNTGTGAGNDFIKGLMRELEKDVESASSFYSSALKKYDASKDDFSVWLIHFRFGDMELRGGNYDMAKNQLLQARSLFDNASLREKYNTLNALATIEYHRSNYEEALDRLNEVLVISEKMNDEVTQAGAVCNIGNIQNDNGNYSEAIKYYYQAQELLKNHLSDDINARKFNMISILNLSVAHSRIGNKKESFDLLKKALSLCNESGFDTPRCFIYISMAGKMEDDGDYEKALDYYNKVIELNSRGENSQQTMQAALVGILSVHLKQENWNEVKKNLDDLDSLKLTPQNQIRKQLIRSRLLEHEEKIAEAVECLKGPLELAYKNNIPHKQLSIHDRLRELALKDNNFEEYVKQNEAYIKVSEETRGNEQQRLMAIQEKEREIAEERQKNEKERDLLYSTLPKHVADRVIAGEKVNDDFESASVMFLDIVDFTRMSSQLPASKVITTLEEIFSSIDDICEKHQVTKIKTIGDAYLAACGVPEVIEGHEEKMLSAACEILKTLSTLKFEHINDIKVRIGLHSGSLSAGVVGKERFQYDVWGDTVNMASRMESSGIEGRIQVSEQFKNAISSSNYRFEERGNVEIKGKGRFVTYLLCL